MENCYRSLKVGHTGQSPKEIADNVVAVANALKAKYLEWDSVSCMNLWATETVSLPVYNYLLPLPVDKEVQVEEKMEIDNKDVKVIASTKTTVKESPKGKVKQVKKNSVTVIKKNVDEDEEIQKTVTNKGKKGKLASPKQPIQNTKERSLPSPRSKTEPKKSNPLAPIKQQPEKKKPKRKRATSAAVSKLPVAKKKKLSHA